MGYRFSKIETINVRFRSDPLFYSTVVTRLLLNPIASVILISAAATSTSNAAPTDEIDFGSQIRPILSKNCFFCHGPDAHERKADLRLDTYEGAIEDRDGNRAIDPDNLADSEFIYRITTDDEDDIMPTIKSHKKLTAEEISLLTRWVESGAEYSDHWAFVDPAKPTPPVESSGWAKNPIDQFVHARLTSAGLEASPEASPEQYIRRVSFDLRGLPPTPSEVDQFVADYAKDQDAAVGSLVDQFLASEHFGERMALAWMDAARYGDTSVMHADGPRDMWRWRDWVIDAYNANKPFSDFLREQLAGDLIPNATFEQKVATGFNRNNATSDEGGAFPEELRVEYTLDRVATTTNVFLGLSVECAQCHDHKYDPISQKEYFSMYAFFNVAADPGMQSRKGNQAPVVEYVVGGDPERAAEIDREVATIKAQLDARMKATSDIAEQWMISAAAESVDSPAPVGLKFHYPLDPDGKTNIIAEVIDEGGDAKIAGNKPAKKTDREGLPALAVEGNTAPIASGERQPQLDVGKPFTVSYWIRPQKNTRTGAIVSRMSRDKQHRGWDLWLQDRRPSTHLIEEWPNNALKVVSKNQLKVDQWQHVVISYDGSRKADGVTIYIDGKNTGHKIETNSLTPDSDNTTETPFAIGRRDKSSAINVHLDDLRFYDRELPENEIALLDSDPVANALSVEHSKRNETQQNVLRKHHLQNIDPEGMALFNNQQALIAERAEVMKDAKKYSSMVMQDQPMNKMRNTYVLDRGQYDSPKEEEVILANVPAAFPPLPDGAPANRLGLAEWFLRDDHPLTARVAVNRYWSMLFGRGIVSSVTDLGNQGAFPTHPELIDWLASDFRENGWDIKRTLRQIVTSATYRQSAQVTPGGFETDPENLLLSRSPRLRLQGEFIRDAALSVGGLLVQELGGPGTKPYQPAGLWNEVSLNNGLRFQQDKGEKLYRKSMYIYWKRSAPHPAMTIFDAPTREKCVVQRPRTNTPLQALVTLNDVQFVEASRKLAERMVTDGGAEFEGRVEQAYLLCLSRRPSETELEICRDVYQTQLASFRNEPERAEKYLAHGEAANSAGIEALEHAALTVLANMIINLDESLTRG